MMVKPHFQILIVLVVALISYGTLRAIQTPPVQDRENIEAPWFLFEAYFYNAAGQKVTLADFQDKVVLVNLWATWCPPCVVELPSLDTLQAKLRDKPFKVVAIAMDRSGVLPVQGFLAGRGIELLDVYWDKDRQIPLKWPYSGLPASFLLDRGGRVVARYDGPQEWHQGEIYNQIVSLLQ